MNEGAGDTYEVGLGGHYSYNANSNPANYAAINADLTYKLRLKVLEGSYEPEPQDLKMLREFKQTKLSPKAFLKHWYG